MKLLVYGATKGKGSGIGRSVAVALLERGHEVKGFCRDPQKAQVETQFSLEANDILTEQGQARLKEVIREFDPDVIWSACGTGYAAPVWSMADSEMEAMIDANVRNNIVFCRTCGPSCVDGGPHLILTGSVAGTLEGVGAAVYSGTKGFLLPFVRSQRAEYRSQGHKLKLSLLMLSSVKHTGLDVVADAVEFIGRQSCSVEILVTAP